MSASFWVTCELRRPRLILNTQGSGLEFMEEMESRLSGGQAAGSCVFRAPRMKPLLPLLQWPWAQSLNSCLAMQMTRSGLFDSFRDFASTFFLPWVWTCDAGMALPDFQNSPSELNDCTTKSHPILFPCLETEMSHFLIKET